MLKGVLIALLNEGLTGSRRLVSRADAWVTGCLCTLLTLGLATSLYAASPDLPDSQQDIIYSADGGGSIETRDTVRITTLRGNVRIQQGLITIFGETASLEQNTSTGELIRVIVAGSPARFSREPDQSMGEIINGSSQTIIYYNQLDPELNAQISVVEFIGDARFTRGRTALQCSSIKHIIDTAATDSPGPCSGILAPVD
jgi:lipopolysaccharide transport protein LptA